MTARLRTMWLSCALTAAGCLPSMDAPLQTVAPGIPTTMDGKVVAPTMQASPATKEEALRIDIVGNKLIQGNRQIGIRCAFVAIGLPTSELFHRGTEGIFITEGLSRKCTSEGRLAALLAYEMGRMVAEREALAGPELRQGEHRPPLESRVGTDSGGTFGPPDGTRLAELARDEKEHPRRTKKNTPMPAPDALLLARDFLERAGYEARELDAVAPLISEARANFAVERQMTGGSTAPARPWTK